MGALDTVKELGRMATTATLSKDVIDLFSKKAELLEEQVATLEQENTVLKTENANLKQKIKDFEQQVSGSHQRMNCNQRPFRFSSCFLTATAWQLRRSRLRSGFKKEW